MSAYKYFSINGNLWYYNGYRTYMKYREVLENPKVTVLLSVHFQSRRTGNELSVSSRYANLNGFEVE